MPQDPQAGYDGHRQKHSRNSTHFPADQDGHNGHGWMQLQSLSHDQRRVDVILYKPPQNDESDEQQPMRIAGEKADSQNDGGCKQRADKGKELEHAGNDPDCYGIWETQYKQEGCVGHDSKNREQKLRANVLRQHRIEIAEHPL